ncbi:hypothetical protein AK812_SmicGene6823 [Symbiodinium microadriaticum]|uniref:Apple domain-containing protein n=1 Tax=Symbiodinium microadriaticum TaxID=2951 RepID=A0A1Q9EQ58_SYMMI|nr:hypothetical protein AK812_SmicGene6823 [Symbiodinium microadriaticum]
MSRHLAVIMVLTSWMPQDVVATCDTAAVMAAATCIQQLSVPTDGNVATACQYVQDYMLCYPGECCTPAVETALASYRQAPLNCAGTTCGGTISQDGGSTTTSCAGTTCGGTISQDGGATTGAGLRGTGECSAVTWIADANIGWTGAETTEASVQTWEDCCNYCNPDVCCGFVLNSDGVCYQKLGSTCDLILDHTTTTTTPHVVGAGLRGTGECSAVTWTADANIGWTGAETTEASVQTWEVGEDPSRTLFRPLMAEGDPLSFLNALSIQVLVVLWVECWKVLVVLVLVLVLARTGWKVLTVQVLVLVLAWRFKLGC